MAAAWRPDLCSGERLLPWTLNYDEIDMVLEGELHVRHQGKRWSPKRGRHVYPERLQHRIRYPVDGALPVRRLAGKLAIAMNDFIPKRGSERIIRSAKAVKSIFLPMPA